MSGRRLVRALVEGLGQAQSGDGCVTAYTVRYHCTLASIAAYGPGIAAAAEQAQRLVAEIIAAYDALGFHTGTTASDEALYDCHGLTAAAQARAQGRWPFRLVSPDTYVLER